MTTRNPDCVIYSTVRFCELGRMAMDEAVTLVPNTTDAKDKSNALRRGLPSMEIKTENR